MRLEDVVPDEPMFTRIPVIVAQRAAVVYQPKDLGTWDYLDQIESAIEIASGLNSRTPGLTCVCGHSWFRTSDLSLVSRRRLNAVLTCGNLPVS